jgi:hypothetical protein
MLVILLNWLIIMGRFEKIADELIKYLLLYGYNLRLDLSKCINIVRFKCTIYLCLALKFTN